MFQIRTVASLPAEAKWVPSGLNATDRTLGACSRGQDGEAERDGSGDAGGAPG